MQGLPIRSAVAAAAAVVEVGHGKAALGPILDARIEHRITGRGRPAMDEHQQRWFFHIADGRVKEPMGLALAAGVAQGLGLADLLGG